MSLQHMINQAAMAGVVLHKSGSGSVWKYLAIRADTVRPFHTLEDLEQWIDARGYLRSDGFRRFAWSKKPWTRVTLLTVDIEGDEQSVTKELIPIQAGFHD